MNGKLRLALAYAGNELLEQAMSTLQRRREEDPEGGNQKTIRIVRSAFSPDKGPSLMTVSQCLLLGQFPVSSQKFHTLSFSLS